MKILITGDFYPSGRVVDLVHSNKIELLFGDFLQFISDSDLAITNLEAPLTNSINQIQKTGPNLKVPPHTADFLKSAGFNLVTLANNHIMDYGKEGLTDTLKVLNDTGLKFIGADTNKEKISNPFLLEKDKTKIAIINVCENEWSTLDFNGAGANAIDPISNYYQIKEVKRIVDKVIVITHGGHEYYNLPSPAMKKLFRFYIDCGADAVINSHTHCISGYEIYKNSPIFYSLGNFVFDDMNKINTAWTIGAAVRLEIRANEKIKFDYVTFNQCNDEPVISIHDSERTEKIKKHIHSLNTIISNDEILKKEFNIFIEKRKKLYRSYLEPHSYKIIGYLQRLKLFPSLWNIKKKKYLYNLIRTESHREILINLLEKDVSNSQ